MTFSHPWAIGLLVALPVIVWLHRRRAPTVVRVASVDPYRQDEGAVPPAAPRRGADLTLALLLAAAACLALAASEPEVERGGTRVRLVIDRSPSMGAVLADGRTTVAESALRRARRLVAAAVPGARVEESGLVGSSRDESARGSRFVLVSDRVPEGADPTLVVVGPEAPAMPNVRISGAERLGDGGVAVTVENFGAATTRVRVRGAAGDAREADVAGRSTATVAFPAIPRGGQVSFRLDAADGFAPDDVLACERRGGAARVAVEGGGPRIAAALRALGIEVVTAGPSDAIVRRGGSLDPAPDLRLVHFAPVTSADRSPLAAVVGPSTRGSDVVAHGDFPLPAPSARLVTSSRIFGGEPLLEDAAGVLAARAGHVVAIAMDPEAEGGDWARDGSFPAALAAALDLVTDGPDRIVGTPAVPRDESDVASSVLPDPSPDAIRAAADRPPPFALGGVLALAGALAAAAAAWRGATARAV